MKILNTVSPYFSTESYHRNLFINGEEEITIVDTQKINYKISKMKVKHNPIELSRYLSIPSRNHFDKQIDFLIKKSLNYKTFSELITTKSKNKYGNKVNNFDEVFTTLFYSSYSIFNLNTTNKEKYLTKFFKLLPKNYIQKNFSAKKQFQNRFIEYTFSASKNATVMDNILSVFFTKFKPSSILLKNIYFQLHTKILNLATNCYYDLKDYKFLLMCKTKTSLYKTIDELNKKLCLELLLYSHNRVGCLIFNKSIYEDEYKLGITTLSEKLINHKLNDKVCVIPQVDVDSSIEDLLNLMNIEDLGFIETIKRFDNFVENLSDNSYRIIYHVRILRNIIDYSTKNNLEFDFKLNSYSFGSGTTNLYCPLNNNESLLLELNNSNIDLETYLMDIKFIINYITENVIKGLDASSPIAKEFNVSSYFTHLNNLITLSLNGIIISNYLKISPLKIFMIYEKYDFFNFILNQIYKMLNCFNELPIKDNKEIFNIMSILTNNPSSYNYYIIKKLINEMLFEISNDKDFFYKTAFSYKHFECVEDRRNDNKYLTCVNSKIINYILAFNDIELLEKLINEKKLISSVLINCENLGLELINADFSKRNVSENSSDFYYYINYSSSNLTYSFLEENENEKVDLIIEELTKKQAIIDSISYQLFSHSNVMYSLLEDKFKTTELFYLNNNNEILIPNFVKHLFINQYKDLIKSLVYIIKDCNICFINRWLKNIIIKIESDSRYNIKNIVDNFAVVLIIIFVISLLRMNEIKEEINPKIFNVLLKYINRNLVPTFPYYTEIYRLNNIYVSEELIGYIKPINEMDNFKFVQIFYNNPKRFLISFFIIYLHNYYSTANYEHIEKFKILSNNIPFFNEFENINREIVERILEK